MGKIISLAKTSQVDELFPPQPLWSSNLKRDDLLKHYVQEGIHVLQGLDNLGNFLMGFGVLMMGYLLNSQLKMHFVRIFAKGKASLALSSWVCLFAWMAAVVLLLGFMYLFIFHLLAGRTVHSHNNQRLSIGKRIHIKHMSYSDFERQAPSFDQFIDSHYLNEDQEKPEQLWYATFRYTRYMAFRKLMIMNKMRNTLAWAMIFGVVFKVSEIWIRVLS